MKSSSVSPNALLLNSLKHASTTSATSSAAGIDHPRALQQHRGMLEVLHLHPRADVDFMETLSFFSSPFEASLLGMGMTLPLICVALVCQKRFSSDRWCLG